MSDVNSRRAYSFILAEPGITYLDWEKKITFATHPDKIAVFLYNNRIVFLHGTLDHPHTAQFWPRVRFPGDPLPPPPPDDYLLLPERIPAQIKLHFAVPLVPGSIITGALCGRSTGLNSTTDRNEVNCKRCLRILVDPAHHRHKRFRLTL